MLFLKKKKYPLVANEIYTKIQFVTFFLANLCCVNCIKMHAKR